MHNGNEHNLPARRAIGYEYSYRYDGAACREEFLSAAMQQCRLPPSGGGEQAADILASTTLLGSVRQNPSLFRYK